MFMLEASPAVESGHKSSNMQTTTVSSADISRFSFPESTRTDTLTTPVYGMHSLCSAHYRTVYSAHHDLLENY